MSTSPPSLQSLRIDRSTPPARSGPGTGRVVFIALALVVLAGAGWFFLAPRATPVRIALVEASGGGVASSEGISANGYVVARTKASVSAKIAGRMEYLGVHEGSRVTKGEVIAYYVGVGRVLLHGRRRAQHMHENDRHAAAGDERPLAALFADPEAPTAWLERWHRRAQQESRSGGERSRAGSTGRDHSARAIGIGPKGRRDRSARLHHYRRRELFAAI